MIQSIGCLLHEAFPDALSEKQWLTTHSPDLCDPLRSHFSHTLTPLVDHEPPEGETMSYKLDFSIHTGSDKDIVDTQTSKGLCRWMKHEVT